MFYCFNNEPINWKYTCQVNQLLKWLLVAALDDVKMMQDTHSPNRSYYHQFVDGSFTFWKFDIIGYFCINVLHIRDLDFKQNEALDEDLSVWVKVISS